MIFLLNDLACFSFRSAAAAEPVQQSLQKNFPHRGSCQADIDEGQIESGNKKWQVFLCAARAVVLSRACNEVGHGRSPCAFSRRFCAVKSGAAGGGSFHDLRPTPSQPWPCKTAWTSRPSAVCWVTTRRASRWTPTPTSPPTPNSKRRKQWAISYPVLSDGFRYPLPLGSAFGSGKSSVRKWQLIKSKSPRNQTISRTFGVC